VCSSDLAFAAAGGHEGVPILPNLRLYVITCLDPRTDPAYVLGLGPGDAVVVRNAGGRVTDEVINDVAFIGQLAEGFAPEGPLFEVAVLHHTQCGTGALADDGFRERFAAHTGADPDALAEVAVLDPEATVRADVARLRSSPLVSDRIAVNGYVYELETGLVRAVDQDAA
jgi:carbonic anhydrase